jgi:hypothetical protein
VRRLLALGSVAVVLVAADAATAQAAAPHRDCGTIAVRSVGGAGSVTLRVLRLGDDGLTCRRARGIARWAYRHASLEDHAVLGDPPGWTCRGSATAPDSGGVCRRRGRAPAWGVLMLTRSP